MNGRVYDPSLGRMLSPDSITQAPENGQNYNRYSYAYNNPLKYSDPSGFMNCELGDSCGDNTVRSNRGFPDLKNKRNRFLRRDPPKVRWREANLAAGFAGNGGTLVSQDGDNRNQPIPIVGAAIGVKPTTSEENLVAEGNLAKMWEGRCAAGDPIGCVGFATWGDPKDVLTMHGRAFGAYWNAIGALVRLNATAGLLAGNPELALDSDALNQTELKFGQAIAVAHLSATKVDFEGIHYFLSAPAITGYHHEVFDEFNVDRGFYGGSYWTGEHQPGLEALYCQPACDSY